MKLALRRLLARCPSLLPTSMRALPRTTGGQAGRQIRPDHVHIPPFTTSYQYCAQAWWRPVGDVSRNSVAVASTAAPTRGFAARSVCLNRPARVVASAAGDTGTLSGEEAFFASEHESFAGLGVSPAIQAALEASGFKRPSRVQELAAPHILRGRNVVVAAETGSGKTLSYLVPIAHLMLKQRAAMQQHAAALEAAGPAAEGADRPRFTRYLALVLCPNVALCQQVAAAVNALRGPAGPDGSGQQQQQQQLVSAAVINSSNPPPFETPDVVVATPAGLLNIIDEAGGAYGWLWSEEGMQARIRHVILDEADLLLTPAYSKATQRILTLFKTADRRRVEAKLFEELGLSSKDEFDRLPRALQVAAWTGGAPAMLAEGYRPRRTLDPNAKYGPYWRRQYIYSAATLPAATYSDVGSAIAKAHPDAVWVSTDLLHASKPQVEHAWREVDDSTFTAALLDAVKSDPDYQAGSGKTLVFAADGASADAVSQVLAGGDVPHVVYHKSRPMGEQAAALAALREQPGCVMVCTDAAARGLDVEAIKHVVQADFAANAIDFIHRIGRTARAGRGGRVTSLFRDHNRALVEVLQTYIADGVALEAAFSRARSFSKKLKKTGGVFVPRGMAAGGEEAAGAGEEEKEGAAEGQEASRAAGAQGRGGPGRGVGGGGRAAGRGRGRAGREQEREVRL